jgi:hypothetical protein
MHKQYLGIIVIFFISFLLSGCCGEIRSGDQKVDVGPLYDIDLNLKDVKKISDVIDASMFDVVEIQEDFSILARWVGPTEKMPSINSSSAIDISFLLFDEVKTAQDNFTSECTSAGWISSDKYYGGKLDNQYCVSQVRRLRQASDAFCQPTNQYVSFVIFQKNRLVISIDETVYSETGHDLVFSKDAVILKLAEELAK